MILYAIALYYILFNVVYILSARESVSRSVQFYVITFTVIGYTVAMVQFFNPELQHFGLAIGGLVIFINLQKSEEYIHADLEIYNQSILVKLTKMNLESDTKMQMLVLQVEDLNFIAHNFGSENRKALLRQIALFLDSLTNKNVYYYKSGLFVILMTGNTIKRLPYFECRIKERFEQRWQLENAPFSINYKLMSFSLPQDIANEFIPIAEKNGTFNGDERYMMQQAYYRINHYKPIFALRGALPLLLQVPFFIAAYQFLSNLGSLKGVSFGVLSDLGEPDGFCGSALTLPICCPF